jgi:hypothetical protein
MIGESSGVTTLINSERLYRENQLRPEGKASDQDEEALAGNISDVTSFSAEALALAQNVVPVSGSSEQGQVERQGRGQEESASSTARFLDIRV